MWNKKTEEQSGLAEGEAKGERLKQLEIAKNLINYGMSIEDIIKTTGLSKEEVEKLTREK